MAFKVSNETKVGALAAVAITFLVLGYNFMSGKGSLFSKRTTFHVEFPNVSDLNTSTPVLYNGFKIGNITDIELNKDKNDFIVYFDITEDIQVPDNSRVKVISSLLGEKSLSLVKGNSQKFAIDGASLLNLQDTGLMESVSLVFKPLSAKINSIVNSLDSLMSDGELNKSVASLNASLKSFTRTSDNASLLLEQNMPKLTNILTNVESITSNLKNNNEQISLIVANLKTTTDNLAAAKIKEAVDNANMVLNQVGSIMEKVNKGEGSLGLLVNDKELYNNLNKTAKDLDSILIDLNKYPAKYIPIPFTKNQRKKAIEESKKNNP